MPHGGVRPGAGRPKGSLNGMRKSGCVPIKRRVDRAPRSPRFNLYEAMHYVHAVEKLMEQPHTFRSGVFKDMSDEQLAVISSKVQVGRGVFYIYALVDPRNGRPFYIGKGQKARAWAHAKDATKAERYNARKTSRIMAIMAAGLQPEVELWFQVPNERAALAIEQMLIAHIPGLTNIVGVTTRARMQAEMKAAKRGLRQLAAGQQRLREMLASGGYDGGDEEFVEAVRRVAYDPLPELPQVWPFAKPADDETDASAQEREA